jgi:hypothetical protein
VLVSVILDSYCNGRTFVASEHNVRVLEQVRAHHVGQRMIFLINRENRGVWGAGVYSFGAFLLAIGKEVGLKSADGRC